ncbi:hypothetical protein SAMN00120144_1596 [Hymenobacter roseosalivarius DSM 11622]|uniref:Uncharacterized protein n=1 Tax=Hymenobacter roseosalivarius DSM 11622 TaxID=645990 RepID=A0A1W1VWM0_9BACT|nr:hypothetical protein SAMN00120144_1596 [Hymenobacter roseosalivarius DSM 11622]
MLFNSNDMIPIISPADLWFNDEMQVCVSTAASKKNHLPSTEHLL